MTTGYRDTLNIEQKTLAPFIYIAIILIGIDMVTTIVGLKIGLEEKNVISLKLMDMFGDFYGLLVSTIGRCIIVIFPMIAYQYVEKELDTTFLKNTYIILYAILIVIAITVALKIDIYNIIAIIDRLQYQDYVHNLN